MIIVITLGIVCIIGVVEFIKFLSGDWDAVKHLLKSIVCFIVAVVAALFCMAN